MQLLALPFEIAGLGFVTVVMWKRKCAAVLLHDDN